MTAITVKDLTKKFKSTTAVDSLSFDVSKNRVVGFLGPNGAGKTTTLRTLVGLSKPTGGSISIAGTDVKFGDSKANRKIGYLPELPSFYSWMTGNEYLNLVADLCKLTQNDKRSRIPKLLKLVDLSEASNKRIGTYSGGMKQRLGIAQALINDPEVIILDEPASALDPLGRKEILSVIERLKKTRTVLFSTHILADVDRICDDVIIINKGKLVVSKPLAELKAEYSSPILQVEFESDCSAIAKKIKNEKWVKKLEQNGNILKVWLNDQKVIHNNLPMRFFADQNIGILQYGLKLPEAEDLFVELLGEND